MERKDLPGWTTTQSKLWDAVRYAYQALHHPDGGRGSVDGHGFGDWSRSPWLRFREWTRWANPALVARLLSEMNDVQAELSALAFAAVSAAEPWPDPTAEATEEAIEVLKAHFHPILGDEERLAQQVTRARAIVHALLCAAASPRESEAAEVSEVVVDVAGQLDHLAETLDGGGSDSELQANVALLRHAARRLNSCAERLDSEWRGTATSDRERLTQLLREALEPPEGSDTWAHRQFKEDRHEGAGGSMFRRKFLGIRLW